MQLTKRKVRHAATGLATAGLLAGMVLATPPAAADEPVTMATLEAAAADFNTKTAVPGTAVVIDEATDKVVVSIDDTVQGAKLSKVRAFAARHGSAVEIERTPGKLRPLINGGDAIYTGGARCSLGFNVKNGSGRDYLVTAGHCTNIGSSWSGQGGHIGQRTGSSFPGNDYGIVRYDSGIDRWGGVGGQDIARAANPSVGQYACRRGSTTGTHCGHVTGTNATVHYQAGAVYGMIKTNICAEPGDSGGPLYHGSTAFGLTSGGSGNCRSGGTTFFQPVVEAMNRYGVWVY